jgi:hypothetical protein
MDSDSSDSDEERNNDKESLSSEEDEAEADFGEMVEDEEIKVAADEEDEDGGVDEVKTEGEVEDALLEVNTKETDGVSEMKDAGVENVAGADSGIEYAVGDVLPNMDEENQQPQQALQRTTGRVVDDEVDDGSTDKKRKVVSEEQEAKRCACIPPHVIATMHNESHRQRKRRINAYYSVAQSYASPTSPVVYELCKQV